MTPRRRHAPPLAWRVLLWLVLALIALRPAGMIRAAETAAPAIAVVTDEAVADFPTGVTFSLTATASTTIARVELLYRAAGEETLRLATPGFVPGTSVEVRHEVDLRAGDLPPGIDVAYHWRLIDAAGGVADTEERVFLWADDRFAWEPLAGERVTVYAYNGDPGFNQTVLDAAERTIAELEADYGATLTTPVRIWVYDSTEDLAGAMRPNTEPWVAGAAFPQYGVILGVLPVEDPSEIDRVVPHEISHQVLHQATVNPFNEPPTWLDEGLAVSSEAIDPAGYRASVLAAAAEGRLESIRVLNSRFPYDVEGAQLAYAQSLSVVEFVRDRYGEEGLARLIAIFREGVAYDEAVRRALGVSLDELDREWRASLEAAADRAGAAGARADDEAGRLSPGQAVALASGALVMALVAMIAVVVGVVVMLRSRRAAADAFEGEA